MNKLLFTRAQIIQSPPGSEMPLMTNLWGGLGKFNEIGGRHQDRKDAEKYLSEQGVRNPETMELGVQYYLAERGHLHSGRQYRDFDQDEREQIIEDFLSIGSKATREKWNISSSVLHHIRWHNKEAEEEIEDRHFAKAGL